MLINDNVTPLSLTRISNLTANDQMCEGMPAKGAIPKPTHA